MFESIGLFWESLTDLINIWINIEIAEYTSGTNIIKFYIKDIILFLFFLSFAYAIVKKVVMGKFRIRDHMRD